MTLVSSANKIGLEFPLISLKNKQLRTRILQPLIRYSYADCPSIQSGTLSCTSVHNCDDTYKPVTSPTCNTTVQLSRRAWTFPVVLCDIYEINVWRKGRELAIDVIHFHQNPTGICYVPMEKVVRNVFEDNLTNCLHIQSI